MPSIEQEKLIPQVLYWLGVKDQDIVSLLREAKENDFNNWQEEVFYILQERVQNEEDFLQHIDTASFSQLWKQIDALIYKEKLFFLLQRILNWDSEKIAKLYKISIEEVNQQLVTTLEKLSV